MHSSFGVVESQVLGSSSLRVVKFRVRQVSGSLSFGVVEFCTQVLGSSSFGFVELWVHRVLHSSFGSVEFRVWRQRVRFQSGFKAVKNESYMPLQWHRASTCVKHTDCVPRIPSCDQGEAPRFYDTEGDIRKLETQWALNPDGPVYLWSLGYC